MVTTATPEGGALLLEAADLDRLHGALRDAGYRVIGPTVRDGAIVLGGCTTGSAETRGGGPGGNARR